MLKPFRDFSGYIWQMHHYNERQGTLMTEKTMISRVRDGDTDVRDELAEKYYGDVYRYCVYRTGSVRDAEDLTQETFLRLYRYFEGYSEMQKFKSYLLTIASNVCKDYLSGRHLTAVLDETLAESDPQISDDKMAVRRAVASLPDDQREVIVLYYFNGMKVGDIAQTLGIPLSTVKTRMARGRNKLKQLLIQEGFR